MSPVADQNLVNSRFLGPCLLASLYLCINDIPPWLSPLKQLCWKHEGRANTRRQRICLLIRPPSDFLDNYWFCILRQSEFIRWFACPSLSKHHTSKEQKYQTSRNNKSPATQRNPWIKIQLLAIQTIYMSMHIAERRKCTGNWNALSNARCILLNKWSTFRWSQSPVIQSCAWPSPTNTRRTTGKAQPQPVLERCCRSGPVQYLLR